MVEIEGLTRDEHIAIIMQVTGEARERAEFIYAIETGEIGPGGDVIVIDDDEPSAA